MIGGENVDNRELKERHKKRKMHAEDQRKKQLIRKQIWRIYSFSSILYAQEFHHLPMWSKLIMEESVCVRERDAGG